MPETVPESDVVAAAADRLYAAAPDEFTALRGELAKAAKADGGAGDAKIIGALRKPTVPASVMNRYALHDPDDVARLSELGDRLRRATNDLDPAKLRELSTERRKLVAELTASAVAHAGSKDPSTAQRDEVSATFDAAVADPDVAQRLGRLLKPEQFSGFGMAGGPELTLVRGGGDSAKKGRKTAEKASPEKADKAEKPPRETATSRRLTRDATKARDAFTAADDALTAAETAEQHAHEQVSTLTDELDRLQRELDDAKTELDQARKAARTAKTKRREARTALDRAERKLEK